MWEEIKKHPYVIVGVVGGIILLYVLSSSGSTSNSSSSVPGESDADVAAAEATNQAQIAANAQIAGFQAAAGSQAEQDSAGLAAAQIQANTTDNANNLSAAVAAQQINAEESVTNTANTLSAQTTQFGEAQQTAQIGISTAGQVADTQALTGALVTVASDQEQASIAQTNATQAIATQSLFSKLF